MTALAYRRPVPVESERNDPKHGRKAAEDARRSWRTQIVIEGLSYDDEDRAESLSCERLASDPVQTGSRRGPGISDLSRTGRQADRRAFTHALLVRCK